MIKIQLAMLLITFLSILYHAGTPSQTRTTVAS